MFVLLHGLDGTRALARVNALIVGREVTRFFAKELPALLETLSEGSFMEERAFVVYFDKSDRTDKGETVALLSQAAAICGDDLVVVLARTKLTPTNPLMVATKKAGGTIESFDPLEGSALRDWISAEATRAGVPLQNGTITYLADTFGGTPYLTPQLQKAMLVTEAGHEEMVRTLCTSDAVEEKLNFNFVDALADRNVAGSLKLLAECVAAGESPEPLIALMRGRVRAMLLASSESADARIVESTGLNAWVLKNARRQGRAWTPAQLRRLLAELLRFEVSVRRFSRATAMPRLAALLARTLKSS